MGDGAQEKGKQIYEAQAAEAGAEGAAAGAETDPNVVDAEVVDEDETKDGDK